MVRLAETTELAGLATLLARTPFMVPDAERHDRRAATRTLRRRLEASEVWVLPHGVAWIEEGRQLHAFYFDGVLRSRPLQEVCRFYPELVLVIPEYAKPVIEWVQRKLGFTHMGLAGSVSWRGRTWPVHRLVRQLWDS